MASTVAQILIGAPALDRIVTVQQNAHSIMRNAEQRELKATGAPGAQLASQHHSIAERGT